ncbi:HD domain-containing protein [Candidatus Woesearchaeota archaeon]|nr:HD domain-containing protein [Candidatus Woesearchaeota archaeon]MBT6518596.1 HD domain-containing protein [Candidatus Woesearchaeota archaeon]MBT7367461.1 HD domain-containing protein [Candidatus Woesearchaeota archaeon]
MVLNETNLANSVNSNKPKHSYTVDLWRDVSGFYNNLTPNGQYESSVLETNGTGHTIDVLKNIKELYKQQGNSVDDEVIAAAMCHDLGYLIKRLNKSSVEKKSDDEIANNHNFYSAKACEQFLKKLGLDNARIKKIKKIIIAHNQDVGSLASNEEKILYVADKMTRLGYSGLNRLCESGGYDENNLEKAVSALDRAEEIMDKTYNDLECAGSATEKVRSKYKEGKEALQRRRDYVNKKNKKNKKKKTSKHSKTKSKSEKSKKSKSNKSENSSKKGKK